MGVMQIRISILLTRQREMLCNNTKYLIYLVLVIRGKKKQAETLMFRGNDKLPMFTDGSSKNKLMCKIAVKTKSPFEAIEVNPQVISPECGITEADINADM